MLDELTAEGRDIALETTLATRSHAHRIERVSLPPLQGEGFMVRADMKTPAYLKLEEDALREAAWKARHGTREERAGKFLGKQAAVEKAVAAVGAEPRKARG